MKQFIYFLFFACILSEMSFADKEKDMNIAELEKRLPELTKTYFDNMKKYATTKSPEDAKYLNEEFFNDFNRRVKDNWSVEKVQLKALPVAKFREHLIKDANYLLATQLYEYKHGIKRKESGYTSLNTKKNMGTGEIVYKRIESSNSTGPLASIINPSIQKSDYPTGNSNEMVQAPNVNKLSNYESKRWLTPFILIGVFVLFAIIYLIKSRRP